MSRYVAITFLLVVIKNTEITSSPLRFTIDCSGSEEKISPFWTNKLREKSSRLFNSDFDVESFCTLIHNAIPKAVEEGKFVLVKPDMDQSGYSDTQFPIAVAPPEGFIPKIGLPKFSKLKIPIIKVPKLRPYTEKHLKTPLIGPTIPFTAFRETEEESSAERVERIKKGLQKVLHIVKVLGQIDHYVSERTRILVEKLAKTLAE